MVTGGLERSRLPHRAERDQFLKIAGRRGPRGVGDRDVVGSTEPALEPVQPSRNIRAMTFSCRALSFPRYRSWNRVFSSRKSIRARLWVCASSTVSAK
jgi:hypothetical protein